MVFPPGPPGHHRSPGVVGVSNHLLLVVYILYPPETSLFIPPLPSTYVILQYMLPRVRLKDWGNERIDVPGLRTENRGAFIPTTAGNVQTEIARSAIELSHTSEIPDQDNGPFSEIVYDYEEPFTLHVTYDDGTTDEYDIEFWSEAVYLRDRYNNMAFIGDPDVYGIKDRIKEYEAIFPNWDGDVLSPCDDRPFVTPRDAITRCVDPNVKKDASLDAYIRAAILALSHRDVSDYHVKWVGDA